MDLFRPLSSAVGFAFLLLNSVLNCAGEVGVPSLSVGNARGFADRISELTLILSRATNTTAFQVDLRFDPLKAELLAPTWSKSLSNHVVRTRELGPGLWRMLVYSIGNELLLPNSAIGTLPIHLSSTERNGSGPITPSRFILARPDGRPVAPVATKSGRVFVTRVSLPDPDGSVSLFFQAQDQTEHVLFASTNLSTWIPVVTNAAFDGIVDFVDADAKLFDYRFYSLDRPQEIIPLASRLELSEVAFMNGAKSLRVEVPANLRFQLEVSTDLRVWTVIGDVTNTTTTIQVPAPVVDESARMFFRLQPR